MTTHATTHSARVEARIKEIILERTGSIQKGFDTEALARELAAKLDAVEAYLENEAWPTADTKRLRAILEAE